jgi:hypothetical protein
MIRNGHNLVLAFDPGVTTGFAIVSPKKIVRSEAIDAGLVLRFARRMKRKYKFATVVIEVGPLWRNDSPLTRNVEMGLKELFPTAALVPPNRWKSHPAATCPETVKTQHERDAVRLARWFMAKRSASGKEEGSSQRAHTA